MRFAPVPREKRDVFHACLNVLLANADGRLAYLRFLDACLDIGSYAEEIAETEEYRSELIQLEEKLWGGECLDLRHSQGQATTQEQRQILNYLEEVMHGTRERAYITEQLLTFADLAEKRETLCLLAALFVFQTTLRMSYLDGLLRLSRFSHFPDAVLWWEEQVAQARQSVKRSDEFTAPLQEGRLLDESFCYALRESCVLLPAIFRCQLQDIHQIYKMLSRPSPCAEYEPADEDAKKWEGSGIARENVGYWRAYGMELDEAVQWIARGFSEPGIAGPWKYRGFEPDEAEEWVEAGYHPKQAAFFRSAGCEFPEEAQRAESMLN